MFRGRPCWHRGFVFAFVHSKAWRPCCQPRQLSRSREAWPCHSDGASRPGPPSLMPSRLHPQTHVSGCAAGACGARAATFWLPRPRWTPTRPPSGLELGVGVGGALRALGRSRPGHAGYLRRNPLSANRGLEDQVGEVRQTGWQTPHGRGTMYSYDTVTGIMQ